MQLDFRDAFALGARAASDDAPAVLIAATSGRALAASARRAGYRPLVADFFGDHDTIARRRDDACTFAGSFARGIGGRCAAWRA